MIEIQFKRVFRMENPNAYFYLPKEIMTDDFSGYSVETKMLFAMLLSFSDNVAASNNDLISVADLLKAVGSKDIDNFRNEIKNVVQEV